MAGIRQIIFNFPTAGRLLAAHEEGEDYTANFAGAKNEEDRVDGQGNPLKELIITAKTIELPKVVNNKTQKTYLYIEKAIKDKPGTVTVTTTDGDTIVMNQAIIVGEADLSVKTETISIKIMGDASSGYK